MTYTGYLGRLAPTLALATALAHGAPDAPRVPPELREAADAAIARGIDWLVENQQPGGAWSNTNYPALTALPLWAIVRQHDDALKPAIDKAVAYILSCVHTTGSHRGAIFHPIPGQRSGGYVNYNTALSIIPLHALDDPELVPVILGAREFLARSQHLDPESLHYGGMGYDPTVDRDYADLANSFTAYEAMHLTRGVEELRTAGGHVDLDWQAALTFIQRIHNHPEFNSLAWATDHPDEKGGFTYRPDAYRPDFGAFEDEDGVLRYRSAPAMSHAGLLSYLYAGVERDDPRVRSTFAWIRDHWDLSQGNRNPELAGKPDALGGLYFMYLFKARAMDHYGEDILTPSDGPAIAWREDMIRAITERQSDDGYWANPYGRYWESDPVLVTAYALLALQSALGR